MKYERTDKNELIIHLMEGYDYLESEDNKSGYGCYLPETNEMYLAGSIPIYHIVQTFLHEYGHYLQHRNNEPFDEEEAEKYSVDVLTSIEDVIIKNKSPLDEQNVRELVAEVKHSEMSIKTKDILITMISKYL